MTTQEPTIVIVPGLRGHVEEHWQTLLAAKLGKVRCVEPAGRLNARLDERVDALQAVVADIEGPIVLVAHSAGSIITVHWAARHGASRPVQGALLATPPDLAGELPAEYPSVDELTANGWVPIPRARLPFRSIVAASTNDSIGDYGRVGALAAAWGSRFVNLGAVGHLNPGSGYGDWPQALELLAELGVRVPAVI
jgi:predicted alpha/beta hydrolase family esterase